MPRTELGPANCNRPIIVEAWLWLALLTRCDHAAIWLWPGLLTRCDHTAIGQLQHAPRRTDDAPLFDKFYAARFMTATWEGANVGTVSARVTNSNLSNVAHAPPLPPLKYPPGYGRDKALGRIARRIANRTRAAYGDIRSAGKVSCGASADPQVAIEAAKAEAWYWRKTPDWQTVPVRPYLLVPVLVFKTPAWFAFAVWAVLFRRRERCPQYAVAWIGRGTREARWKEASPIRDSEILSEDAIKRSGENNKRPKSAPPNFQIPNGEELRLVELARGGDRPAHDRLTLGYWWLARTIARPFATASVPSDELAVQALIGTPNGKDKITNGLAYAIKKYKRNEKRGFRNHAAEAMRWAIQEFLRQNPTRKSLSEERYKDDVSGRPITWLESVVDETPDYVAEVKWRLGLAILDSLEPIAKRIFIARHCFEDKRPTLHQLARQFDCSHEGVRRILLKAESFVRQRCEKSRVEN